MCLLVELCVSKLYHSHKSQKKGGVGQSPFPVNGSHSQLCLVCTVVHCVRYTKVAQDDISTLL